MKIRYLGTAASEGVPAVFCNCAVCREARNNIEKELRTRSQVLIDDDLLIDFPPDTYYHAIRGGIDMSAVKYLLVTHSHTDHFYAQEFVNRGYKFAEGMVSPQIDIYANSEVMRVFGEGSRREMRDSVRASIGLHTIRPFDSFTVGGYSVLALPAEHTPKEDALLFCVSKGGKTLLYLNDTGALRDECYSFLSEKGICADMVSFDCTFADDTRPHSARHMGFDENERVREKLRKKRLVGNGAKYYVTHFSHNSAPYRDRMDYEANRRGFIAAYDGLQVEI